MSGRYFESTGEDARTGRPLARFWEVELRGRTLVTREGAIGRTGQRKVAETALTPTRARKRMLTMIDRKTAQGFVEHAWSARGAVGAALDEEASRWAEVVELARTLVSDLVANDRLVCLSSESVDKWAGENWRFESAPMDTGYFERFLSLVHPYGEAFDPLIGDICAGDPWPHFAPGPLMMIANPGVAPMAGEARRGPVDAVQLVHTLGFQRRRIPSVEEDPSVAEPDADVQGPDWTLLVYEADVREWTELPQQETAELVAFALAKDPESVAVELAPLLALHPGTPTGVLEELSSIAAADGQGSHLPLVVARLQAGT